MPADSTVMSSLDDTAMTQTRFEYDETFAQLVILQNAFRSVLDCAELRDADPPLLDALDALTERFRDVLERN